jgi:periplasmic copper chaperone A
MCRDYFALRSLLAAILVGIAMSAPSHANPAAASDGTRVPVTIETPWVRATVPAQRATGIFLTLRTQAAAMALVEARSPAAAIVEIHEMKHVDGVMQMRAIDRLPFSPREPGILKPGGHHIMLIDLKAQVKEGDTVPLTLVFEDAQKVRKTVEVAVPARKRAP